MTTEPNAGGSQVEAWLNKVAELMDQIDESEARTKTLKKQRAAIEGELCEFMDEHGLASCKNDRLTISRKEAESFTVPPEHWTEFMEWCVQIGLHSVIQRRMSDRPLKDYLDNDGTIPSYVKLNTYIKTAVRRL